MTEPASPAERAERLRRVFGDPLPATTADERAPDGAADADEADRDRQLLEDRPPHHG